MAGGILPSSSRRRRLRRGAASPRPYLQMVIGTDSMLAVLMTAGLMLSDPVLAQQPSDPGQDLFPANLLLELTAEYISEEGRQIVVTPLFVPRETCDDLLFTEPPGQTEFNSRQLGDRPPPASDNDRPYQAQER